MIRLNGLHMRIPCVQVLQCAFGLCSEGGGRPPKSVSTLHVIDYLMFQWRQRSILCSPFKINLLELSASVIPNGCIIEVSFGSGIIRIRIQWRNLEYDALILVGHPSTISRWFIELASYSSDLDTCCLAVYIFPIGCNVRGMVISCTRPTRCGSLTSCVIYKAASALWFSCNTFSTVHLLRWHWTQKFST